MTIIIMLELSGVDAAVGVHGSIQADMDGEDDNYGEYDDEASDELDEEEKLVLEQQHLEIAAQQEEHAETMLKNFIADACAMLEHGSDGAKERAAASVAQMAKETIVTQPFHPLTFRNAVVEAGMIPHLVKLLEATSTAAKAHALGALALIATDDPTTDSDNGNGLAVCVAGGAQGVAQLLAHADEHVQVGAADCAAILAEIPQCQSMLTQHGAEEKLVLLASFGNDLARARAIAALELLSLNNPAIRDSINAVGGQKVLDGIFKYGNEAMRSAAASLAQGLASDDAVAIAVDAKAHARQAHETRMKHSRLLDQATGVRRAVAPGAEGR